jgi:uncharacterized membrane protein
LNKLKKTSGASSAADAELVAKTKKEKEGLQMKLDEAQKGSKEKTKELEKVREGLKDKEADERAAQEVIVVH